MAPLDRSYTTSYQSVIVRIALSSTIFEIFDDEEYCDLEIIHNLHITEIHMPVHGTSF